jgi:hypothetical protein
MTNLRRENDELKNRVREMENVVDTVRRMSHEMVSFCSKDVAWSFKYP